MESRRFTIGLATMLMSFAVTLPNFIHSAAAESAITVAPSPERTKTQTARSGMYYIGSHYECGVFISGRWYPELYPNDGAFALVFDELDPPRVLYQSPFPLVKKNWRIEKWKCRNPRNAGFTEIGSLCSGTRHLSVSCDHLGCCYW